MRVLAGPLQTEFFQKRNLLTQHCLNNICDPKIAQPAQNACGLGRNVQTSERFLSDYSMIQEIFSHPVLIFGCGNTLLGDDGFGPGVIEHLLQDYVLPDYVFAVDVGTGVRNVLLDLLLMPEKPRKIFIVDAVIQANRKAGELFEIELEQIPLYQNAAFSLHRFPSVNLLTELRDAAGVEVRILAVQAKHIPAEVSPGLSAEVDASLRGACLWLLDHVKEGA